MAYGETPVSKGEMVRIVDGAAVDTFVFQFNPTTVKESLSTDWQYTKAPGQYLPAAQFSRFGKTQLDFQLYLFGRDAGGSSGRSLGGGAGHWNGPVLQQVARLKLFQSPSQAFTASSPQFISPGICKVTFGSRVWTGVIPKLDFSYTMFDRNFDPIEAKVSVSLIITSQGIADEVAHLGAINSRAGGGGG